MMDEHSNIRPERGSALVTDVRLNMALPVIRSLGAAGITVHGAEKRKYCTAPVVGFASRFIREKIQVEEFEDILRYADKVDVVIPISGEAVKYFAATDIGSKKCALPSPDALATANDKAKCVKLCENLGIPTPRCYHPENSVDPELPPSRLQQELESWASSELKFPAIVKFRFGEELGLDASQRYLVVTEPSSFARAYLKIHSLQKIPVVQEYVVGDDVGAAILVGRDGGTKASFTYRAIRLNPRIGGPTVHAKSEWMPKLVSYLEKLLCRIGWCGIAMADFRLGRDGEFKFLEINPRFWGSLALAVEAGVDFPLAYYQIAAGQNVSREYHQKDGVEFKFLLKDLRAIMDYARQEPQPAKYVIRETLKTLSWSVPDGVFKLMDPMPGVAYLGRALSKASAQGLH